jgi:multiple sugar transport system substrate-binding protein
MTRSISGHVTSRRTVLLSGLAAGAALALPGCSVTGTSGKEGSAGSGKGTLQALFMQQAGYSVSNVKEMIAAFQETNSDIKVVPTFVTYEALHDKIVTAAAAGTYDVVLIDVIWPAEFGAKSIVADVTSRYPASWAQQMLGGALTTARYDQKYYGVPWGVDTKFFYSNTELMAKAGVTAAQLETWDGVLAAAKAIKSKAGVRYPLVWSWSQAEALMCDFAQLVGAFGGQFLDDAGKLVINQGGAVKALEWMRKTITDGLTNPASTTFLEADVEKTLNNGQAAFGLNWTYFYGVSNDPKASKVVGKINVGQTPAGPSGKRPGVNGSMALSITKGSKNQDAAWTFIEYLASEPVLNKYAKSALPIWTASYDKPDVVKTAPKTFAAAGKQLTDLIVRPQVVNYNGVSQLIQVELQNALLGKKSAQKALDDAVAAATPKLGG